MTPLDMNVIVLRGLLSHKACVRFVGQAFADKYSAKETAGAISESIKAAGATPAVFACPCVDRLQLQTTLQPRRS
jgi:hypothetical protein